jgi:hypothetical protein
MVGVTRDVSFTLDLSIMGMSGEDWREGLDELPPPNLLNGLGIMGICAEHLRVDNSTSIAMKTEEPRRSGLGSPVLTLLANPISIRILSRVHPCAICIAQEHYEHAVTLVGRQWLMT